MTKSVLFLTVMFFLLEPAAQAETVPAEVLQKDYENCMGGANAPKDPLRAQYCDCIRDKMKGWDINTYGALAMEQSQAGETHPVSKIEELAKEWQLYT